MFTMLLLENEIVIESVIITFRLPHQGKVASKHFFNKQNKKQDDAWRKKVRVLIISETIISFNIHPLKSTKSMSLVF